MVPALPPARIVLALAGLVVAAAVAFPARRPRERLRSHAVRPPSRPPTPGPAPTPAPPPSGPGEPPRAGTPRSRGPRLASAAAALGTGLLAGPRAGPPLALAVAIGTTRLFATLPARAAAERDRACAAAVPLVADLVAACLLAGAPLDAALDAACAAAQGPLADDLGAAARAARLGVPPRVAWAPLLAPERPPAVRALARPLVRAAGSAVPPAALLRTVADDTRAAARNAGEVAARRAAVAAVLPLGTCFLPAFVLVGIVPLVAGLVAAATR
jgi:Flp pilus assembly protein TadB